MTDQPGPDTGPAFEILQAFCCAVDGGSLQRRSRTNWTIAATAVNDVLRAIITGRVKFSAGDWKAIVGLVGGRWGSDRVVIGADGGEGWYRLACQAGNASAAASFEHAKGRKPFRVRPLDGTRGYGRGDQLDRLYQGARFADASGNVWSVTSIPSAGEIIVCRYDEGRSAPVARKRLDHAGLAALVSP